MNNKKNTLIILFIIGILPLEINGFYNWYISRFPAFYWLVEVLTWILLPLSILTFGVKNKVFGFKDLGFHSEVFDKKNSYLFFVSILVVTFLGIVIDVSSYYSIKKILNNYGMLQFDYKGVMPKTGILSIIVLLHFCLSAGFVEEIYFRGMFRLLFNNSSKNKLLYVLTSSIIFSAAHWEGGIWNLFEGLMVGVFFAMAYLRLKNLWPLIIGHIACDYYWFS
ncbi:MAG: CPBP family intramembrane metalloprotease [Elusimicrobia bacterium]|nr:CPBP family intramembrane metalloprotease [Candidatus Liberimonas magnetica]